MKTTIFSLIVVLAFLISPAIAQKSNGYDANKGAQEQVKVFPAKGVTSINVQYTDPVKDVVVTNPNNACACDIPRPWFAKYISPLGFFFRISSSTGSTVSNNTTIQKKK